MKYTQVPANTFEEMQLNAGILVKSFTPDTGVIGDLLGATSGGVNFKATPTYSDFGEDIDNCPKNTMELKKLDSWEATMAGTMITVSAETAKDLLGAADIDADDPTHIVPRNDILEDDFNDVWWVGDYSAFNGEKNGGFCAIHMKNALSTDGFQIQSTDKKKGTFAFTYTAHYSMANTKEVPFDIYIKAGTEED